MSREIPLRYRWFDHLLEVDKKAYGITPAVITVAAVIRYYTNGDGRSWPSLRTIAAMAGVALSTVAEAVDHLEHLGYLEAERVHRRSIRYTLVIPNLPTSVPTIGTGRRRRRTDAPPLSVPMSGTGKPLSVPMGASICTDSPAICTDERYPTLLTPPTGEPAGDSSPSPEDGDAESQHVLTPEENLRRLDVARRILEEHQQHPSPWGAKPRFRHIPLRPEFTNGDDTGQDQ